ncbi:MAG: hypothetical protein LUE90_00920 [Clostridiales bacterium]|nr:hypothetical protein [Clostridiales bacterium]
MRCISLCPQNARKSPAFKKCQDLY